MSPLSFVFGSWNLYFGSSYLDLVFWFLVLLIVAGILFQHGAIISFNF
jgi:hypothetical protein